MDLVTELAKELRDLEYARACSPSGPPEQSEEWAAMRIRAILPTVVERLTSPAVVEEAEPIVERAYEDGFQSGRDNHTSTTRPGQLTREVIITACRRVGLDERPAERYPPADLVFDALASALLRCGFGWWEFVLLAAGEVDPSQWFGLVLHPGDADAYVALRTYDLIERQGLEGVEAVAREVCEVHDVEYVEPSEVERAALRRWADTLATT